MIRNHNVKVLVALAFLSLPMGACQRENENVGPDLTTSLTGQFPATYLIAPTNGTPSASGANSWVRFERKNNNTLRVTARIDDGTTQLTDQFDATVTSTSLTGNSSLIPGIQNRYRLTYGSGSSHVDLYKDGNVRGGIAFVKAQQIISLAFLK